MESDRLSYVREIAEWANENAERVFREILPGGSLKGHWWVVLNPTRGDKSAGSFMLNAWTGRWSDYATGDHGDALDAVMYVYGFKSLYEAAQWADGRFGVAGGAGRPLPIKIKKQKPGAKRPPSEPAPIVPVPESAGSLSLEGLRALRLDKKSGKYVEAEIKADWLFEFRTPEGDLVGYRARADRRGERKKQIFYISWCEWEGRQSWHLKGWGGYKPLYRQEALSKNPGAKVLIVEGEKKCELAQRELEGRGWETLSVMTGAGYIEKTDFSPVFDRQVFLWPDCDADGKGAAAMLKAQALIPGSMAVAIPEEIAGAVAGGAGGIKSWDVADAIETQGWKGGQIEDFILKNARGAPDPANRGEGGGWKTPEGWIASESQGIRRQTGDGYATVSRTLARVTGRFQSVDTKTEQVEVTVYDKEDGTKKIVCPVSEIADRAKIIRLADAGLPVTSSTAKDLVDWLEEDRAENKAALPLQKTVSRAGWVDGYGFFPYCEGLAYVQPENAAQNIFEAMQPKGSLEEWAAEAWKARGLKGVRVCMGAAFASPLLGRLGKRSGVCHMWGDSGGGKSAAMVVAESVFGNPEGLGYTFNATLPGIEAIANLLKNVPLFIDELQVKPGGLSLDEFVYMLAAGQGKARGTKTGGGQNINRWLLNAITNGEQPITGDSTGQGAKNRVLEWKDRPFEDPEYAAYCHSFFRSHYGRAGKKFVDWLPGRDMGADFALAKGALAKALERPGGGKGEKFEQCAVFCLADWYSLMAVWGKGELESLASAASFYAGFIADLREEETPGIIDRAYEYITGFIAANSASFQGRDSKIIRGCIVGDECRILTTEFGKAMKEGGYNARQALRGFVERRLAKSNTGTHAHVPGVKNSPFTYTLYMPIIAGHVEEEEGWPDPERLFDDEPFLGSV